MEKTVDLVLIGAGDRGAHCYAKYVTGHPEEARIVAVAEPNASRRAVIAGMFHLPPERQFENYDRLFSAGKLGDAVLVCTRDNEHYIPSVNAMRLGYDVLVEKPVSVTEEECRSLYQVQKETRRRLCVCHVLRYTAFYSQIKSLISEGAIGKVMTLQQNEDIGYWHYAHSFVRGNWHSQEGSSPMLLAKCVHDIDLLMWLSGSRCKSIASFGALSYFKKENMPPDAPERCLDGCPHHLQCIYYAPRLYMTGNTDWPTSTIGEDMSLNGRQQALREGPYGKCVYRCNNDVTDHQVVDIEFEDGVTATFTVSAFTSGMNRTINITGTKGQIAGDFEKNLIIYKDFKDAKEVRIQVNVGVDTRGHGGGDDIMMREFLSLLKDRIIPRKMELEDSIESHLMVFAAEKSRCEGKVISFGEYLHEITN